MTTAAIPPAFAAASSPPSARTCAWRAWPLPSASPSPPASNTPTSSMPPPSACWPSTATPARRRCSTVPPGTVNWTVPAGNWEIVLPKWQFRSGTVHSANGGNPTTRSWTTSIPRPTNSSSNGPSTPTSRPSATKWARPSWASAATNRTSVRIRRLQSLVARAPRRVSEAQGL